MSRYFYLICFSLIVNWGLCYKFIAENNLQHRYEKRQDKNLYRGKSLNRLNKPENKRARKKRPVYSTMYDDTEPMAQINVADFIQNSDDYISENDRNDLRNKDSQLSLDLYGQPEGENLDTNKIVRRSQYYQDSKEKDLQKYTSDNQNKPLNTDKTLLHGCAKKCSMKYVKFPFFFHKNESLKGKKRKLFRFSCPKKGGKPLKSTKTSITNMVTKPYSSRSFIHNSRQTSRHDLIGNTAKEKENMNLYDSNNFLRVDTLEDDLNNNYNVIRFKRQRNMSNDKARQLKELEDLEKKINNLEIASIGPTYTGQTGHN